MKEIKRKSILTRVVRLLLEGTYTEESEPIRTDLKLYDLEVKLRHNDIKEHDFLIYEALEKKGFIDSLYQTIDLERPLSKQKFYEFVNTRYKREISKLLNNNGISFPEYKNNKNIAMEIIRSNSDNILDNVFINLKQYYYENIDDINNESDAEEVDKALMDILHCAFMDCKVLEKP